MTLTADVNAIHVGSITTWEGWADKKRTVELRKPSIANDARRWALMRENHQTASTHDELRAFLRAGGHALVRKAVVESWWPRFLESSPCLRHALFGPFVALDQLPPQAHARFPRGSLRQLVFARDGDRCRVCGRSPDDQVDIRLDLHHIVEWKNGGLTVEDNLITLCRTCHDGLDPADGERREDLSDKVAVATARQHRWRHDLGVHHYRRHLRRLVRPPSDLATMPTAVLSLEWNDLTDLKEAYAHLAANSLTRSYTPRAWARTLRLAFGAARREGPG
jgi:hypothetical protein